MKKTLLTLSTTLILALTPAVKAAPVIDSCWKMIYPNTYNSQENEGYWNPDSTRVDSCLGSPTYGKLYVKRYFSIVFPFYKFPFDTTLKKLINARPKDIRSIFPKWKQGFLNLESKYGNIYFSDDYVSIVNPILRISLDNYVNMEEFIKDVNTDIDSLRSFIYLHNYNQPVKVEEYEDLSSNIYPNPCSDKIFLNSNFNDNKYVIFNSIGRLAAEGNLAGSRSIDVSILPNGLYLIIIDKKRIIFTKE